MSLAEDQHRPQAHGRGTATTNVDAQRLGLGEELVTARGVEGEEGALALAS